MTNNIINFPAMPSADWSELDSVRDILLELYFVHQNPAAVQMHAVEALELVEAMIAKGGAA